MTTLVHTTDLNDTEGFDLESADGAIGRVEEIWLGPDEEPQALAIRMTDRSRALLLGEDVVAVDREHHWVVVGAYPGLLELDAPRLESTGGRPAASWATTGVVIHPEPPSTPGVQVFRRRMPNMDERPLGQLVVTLYAAVALIVVFVVALVFVVSWIVAGHPY